MAAWWDRPTLKAPGMVFALVLLLGMEGGQFHTYRENLYKTQTAYSSSEYGLIKAVRLVTNPEDVVVAHSPGWSSNIAYYTHRRMLIIPDSQMFHHENLVNENLKLLEGEAVPLLLVMDESHDQAQWITARIDELGLWPVPLFNWSNRVSAYARLDRLMEMQTALRNEPSIDVKLGGIPSVAGADKWTQVEVPKEGTEWAKFSLFPLYRVLPFGFQINTYEGQPTMLAHATTELYFARPAGATEVDLSYVINPVCYESKDFDGVLVMVDTVSATGKLTATLMQWESPQALDQSMRNLTLKLPDTDDERLLLRALPGPRDNNAYD